MLDWDTLVPGKRDNSAGVLPLENGAAIMQTYAPMGRKNGVDLGAQITGHNDNLDGTGQRTAQTIPAYPGTIPVNPACRDTLEANNGGASGATIPVIPFIPAEKQGYGKKNGKIEAGGGVAADDLCARKTGEKQEEKHPLSVYAVALVLAYCEKAGASMDEITVALVGLQTMPPDEQVKRWRQSCLEEGITL